MLIQNDLKTFEHGDWVIRFRQPAGAGPFPVVWLLHGWTGDEDSMWIFASKLPERFLLLAPRGLHATPMGGYSWHPLSSVKAWPWVEDFRPAVQALVDLMAAWPEGAPPANFDNLRLAGFSQGGAMAYTFAMLHPQRVRALAGLASFLPDGAAQHLQSQTLAGLPVYISHGTQDQMIPVARARQAVQLLEQAGAEVHYCESDVGHKLSADCFRGMEVFFEKVE